MLVTESPRGVGRTNLAGYESGTRIVLAKGTDVRLLTRGFDAAAGPSIAPDGKTMLFSGRRKGGEPFAIHEMAIATGRTSLVVALSFDLLDPFYLSRDRIAFVAHGTDDKRIFVSGRDGSDPHPITPSGYECLSPTIIDDGRLVFASRFGLFSLNPDGTGIDGYAGLHEAPRIRFRPRRAEGDRLLLLSRLGEDLRIEQIDVTRPNQSIQPVPGLAALGRIFSVEGTGPEGLLVAASQGVYRVEPGGKPRLLFHEEGWGEIEAVPVEPRSWPRKLPGHVRKEKATGRLLCLDANRSDGLFGPRMGERQARELLAGSAFKPLPLERDASFFIEVPADQLLSIATADGSGLIASCAPIWVRPGEIRTCFGCHEGHDAAPHNRRPAALDRAAVRLERR